MGLSHWRCCSNVQSEPAYKRWIEKIKQVREERLEKRRRAEEKVAEAGKTEMTQTTLLAGAETDVQAVGMDRKDQSAAGATTLAAEAVRAIAIATAETATVTETGSGEATGTTGESLMTVD